MTTNMYRDWRMILILSSALDLSLIFTILLWRKYYSQLHVVVKIIYIYKDKEACLKSHSFIGSQARTQVHLMLSSVYCKGALILGPEVWQTIYGPTCRY